MVVRWIGVPTIAVNVVRPYVAISAVWAGPEDGIQDEVGSVEPEGIVSGIGPKGEAQYIAPKIGPAPAPVIPVMPPMVPSLVSAEGVAPMPMIVRPMVVSLVTMHGMSGVSVGMATVMATTSGMMSSTMMPSTMMSAAMMASTMMSAAMMASTMMLSTVPTAMMPSAVPTAMMPSTVPTAMPR